LDTGVYFFGATRGNKMKSVDVYVKELKESKGPLGMTWLAFCTKYPDRAARMLEVSTKTQIEMYEKLKK
jgi:hypothetical protein